MNKNEMEQLMNMAQQMFNSSGANGGMKGLDPKQMQKDLIQIALLKLLLYITIASVVLHSIFVLPKMLKKGKKSKKIGHEITKTHIYNKCIQDLISDSKSQNKKISIDELKEICGKVLSETKSKNGMYIVLKQTPYEKCVQTLSSETENTNNAFKTKIEEEEIKNLCSIVGKEKSKKHKKGKKAKKNKNKDNMKKDRIKKEEGKVKNKKNKEKKDNKEAKQQEL